MKRTPLTRHTPLRSGKGPSRKTRLAKSNPARQARHDAEYRRKLAAYRRSETYKLVAARAGGRCEYVRADGLRCTATEKLQQHHRNYRRFGGEERPEDMIVACAWCHAILESAYPTRRHGRRSA